MMGSQLVWMGSALASQAPSAEMNLLQSAIALQGQSLSPQEEQAQISALVANYAKTASIEGQEQRMEQALVSLNMYTADQAHSLMSSVEASSQNLSAANNEEALQANLSQEISSLAANYPAGAQYSRCDLGTAVGLSSTAAFVTGGIVWALSSAHNGQSSIKTGAEIFTAAAAVGIVVGVVLATWPSEDGC